MSRKLYAYAGDEIHTRVAHAKAVLKGIDTSHDLAEANAEHTELTGRLAVAHAETIVLREALALAEDVNAELARGLFFADARAHQAAAQFFYKYTPEACAQRLAEASREFGGQS